MTLYQIAELAAFNSTIDDTYFTLLRALHELPDGIISTRQLRRMQEIIDGLDLLTDELTEMINDALEADADERSAT